MDSCSEQGAKLLKVITIAEEIQKGKVDIPGFQDFLSRKTQELKEAVSAVEHRLNYTETAHITDALSELSELHELAHNRRIAATEEIIRTFELPTVVVILNCMRERITPI